MEMDTGNVLPLPLSFIQVNFLIFFPIVMYNLVVDVVVCHTAVNDWWY